MSEQKRGSPSLINLTLKNAAANLEMEPKDRKAAYRLTSRLLKFSVKDEDKRNLATALNYENAELMDDDINALARLIVQAQRAFGESEVPTGAFEPDNESPGQGVATLTGAENREMNAAQELKAYYTAQLVTELELREGVETHRVDPYASFDLHVEGPAGVLVVID